MKNLIIALLLVTTIALGGLYWREAQKATQTQTALAALEQKDAQLQSTMDAQERRTEALRKEIETTHTKTAATVHEAAQAARKAQARAANNSATGKSKTGDAFSGMMREISKNPQMREMIKAQQKAALGPMTEQNYSKLFSQLHLTPEQSSALKDLIVSKQLAAADLGMSMFDGDTDAAKRAELGNQVKAASDDADAKIKDLLGDANFKEFQSYEKNLPDRMSINSFKAQLGSDVLAMSGSQEDQLFEAMSQERQNFKFTSDLSDKSKWTGDYATLLSEDKVNTFMDESSKLNQQYIQRAQGILNTDQLASFQKFLEGQQAMQKMGMQMAAKMFGSKPSGN